MSAIRSKKLAIYYGWPSSINGTFSVAGAINVFKSYSMIVLGAGLEDPAHPDHANTAAIIAGLPNQKIFGYIDSTLNITDIQTKIDNWNTIHVEGIFCDIFGYDFGLTRTKQNLIVDYIHSKNLAAFVNAWNPDDAFAPTTNEVTHLGPNDWILAESYQIINDEYQDQSEWMTRSSKLLGYKNATGVNIAGITTTVSGVFDQKKYDYAYFSALLYGFDAFGWGEKDFSSASAQLPLRPRKAYYGSEYASGISYKNGILERKTNAGFQVNTITRTVDFVLQ